VGLACTREMSTGNHHNELSKVTSMVIRYFNVMKSM
jgi:hypothetical protein